VAFEVEHQLGVAAGGGQQLVEQQPRRPRGREFPAIPEDRERTYGLSVAHLEAAAEQVDVSLDEPEPQRLRRPQALEIVPGPVGDDERRRHACTHRHERVYDDASRAPRAEQPRER
jgi:hypothetical protein